ncbi:uncharacterized protein LOC113859382 [Abrus precatorius]|uniref:Uncharacterized protein LOC113859382 n=1 Tax=Abrus precatorius TaxID=3816 RepID=A0A8B8KX99_ABRPR|nr:uncharacterized protein LOC113859382 [Abrus precatorius]
MDELEEHNEDLRNDVNQLKEQMTQILEALKSLERRTTEGTPTQAPPPQPTPTYPLAENPPNTGQPSNQSNPAQPSGLQIQPTQTSIPSYAYPQNTYPREAHIPHTIPTPNQSIHHQPQITNPSLDGNLAISPFHSHKTLEEPQPNYSEEYFQFREKLQILEERLRAIERSNYGIGEAADLCLVPDVIVPPKFKVPDFDKYKGMTCPKSHLIILIGGALSWYMHLEHTRIRSWKDLVDAFLKQYKYNIDMAPDRLQLQNMIKKENESFKEYVQRWRELAAQVEPPLSEKEMVAMFIDTLQSPFYNRMIRSVSSNFSNIVIIGERVENGMRTGKIPNSFIGMTNTKKPQFGIGKKKEGETNAITFHPREVSFIRPNHAPFQFQPSFPIPHMSYPYVNAISQNLSPQSYQSRPYQPAPPTFPIAPPMRPPQHWNQNPNLNQIRPQNNQERKQVQFNPIPMSYTELLPCLFQSSLVVPCPMKPVKPPYLREYDLNAKCEYHAGGIGHSTENCRALKFKDNPNIRSNPLSGHGGPSVNAIKEQYAHVLNRKIEEVTTSLKIIFAELYKVDLIKGFVHKERIYVGNFKENQTQGVNSDTLAVSNITGVGGMTRNGRIYTPEELRKERTKEIERSSKGKAKLGEFEDADEEKMPEIKKDSVC